MKTTLLFLLIAGLASAQTNRVQLSQSDVVQLRWITNSIALYQSALKTNTTALQQVNEELLLLDRAKKNKTDAARRRDALAQTRGALQLKQSEFELKELNFYKLRHLEAPERKRLKKQKS